VCVEQGDAAAAIAGAPLAMQRDYVWP